jgi:gamma-glutamylcyclotransferase (GGCT)/AIG2-like uncharacterized protein YtfP
MVDRLFVYGTLAPGRPNAHVLADLAGTWQPATVRGRLLEQGWGAAAGFPGIVVDEQGPEVHGMVFSSDELNGRWEWLDGFEGEGYERVPAPVRLVGGETCVAYVYALRVAADGVDSIPSE